MYYFLTIDINIFHQLSKSVYSTIILIIDCTYIFNNLDIFFNLCPIRPRLIVKNCL